MAKKAAKKAAKVASKKAAKKQSTKKAAKKAAKKVAGKPARKPMVARRADLGANADNYFATLPAKFKELGGKLREIVRGAAPAASEAIKWGMPVYELSGMLCYICDRKNYMTLGFYQQAVFLDDPQGRLEGTGKTMRHLKIASMAEVDEALFTKWVRHAAEINVAG